MLIAARNGMMVGGGWKNPYVTDGLIAMWDGEWNAGGGVHDPNATVWKDLVGECVFSWTGGAPQWGVNALVTRASFYGTSNIPLSRNHAFTCECVIQRPPGIAASKWNAVSLNYAEFGGGGRGAFYAPFQDRVCVAGNLNGTAMLQGSDIHYVCGTYDGVISKAYIDGALFSTLSPFASPGTSASSELIVGALYASIYSETGYVFNIRLSSRALTTSEIAHNYAVEKARFNLP